MDGKYAIIRNGIRHRSRLLARHRGIWLTLCPYMLGWCDEHPYLVAYAATGTPGWLSLRVAELSNVRVTDGPWLPATAVPPPDMEMDLEVEVAPWWEGDLPVQAQQTEARVPRGGPEAA